MSLSFEIYVLIALFLVYADLLIMIKIILNRMKATNKREDFLTEKRDFIRIFSKKSQVKKLEEFPETYQRLRESILLNYTQKDKIEASLFIGKAERKSILELKSHFKLKRMEGAVRLACIASDQSRIALEKAIKKEKDIPTKLYMANALADIGNKKSIPALTATLLTAHRWYRSRINRLIIGFGEDFNHYLPKIMDRPEAEIKELIVDAASVNFSKPYKAYLIRIVEKEGLEYSHRAYESMNKMDHCCGNCINGRISDLNEDRICKYRGAVSPYDKCWRFKRLPVSIDGSQSRLQLVYKAAEILADYYPRVLQDEKYLKSDDVQIKNIAVKALSKSTPLESIEGLIDTLKDPDVAHTSVKCLLQLIDHYPKLLQKIVYTFEREKDEDIRAHLSDILSYKMEYFIMKLMSQEKKTASLIISQSLLQGRTSELVDFMNKNKNMAIENELILIIKQVIQISAPSIEKEICQYVSPRILEKCGLTPYIDVPVKKPPVKDKNITRLISAVLLFMVILFPAILLIRYSPRILTLSPSNLLIIYVVGFNYFIAYYSIAINGVYLILIALSAINVRRQSKLWDLKSTSFLFKEKMLPGISIIAPAYNEEKTIIESANSLLNLVYPDYELIIVNDGSIDHTMEVLIKTFDLKRMDFKTDTKLKTKPVRGIYRNKSIPKLIVVDKVNGGKADSLNAGINTSQKEYFCGIDADSILEPDALLKLASSELDVGVETPALGGNVFPANGCTIEKGSITHKGFPKNPLARLQTIEYMRAFMAGRLGWAFSNSLLIISGSFGLFRTERVLDVGGYLTISGKYEKDTVGEDMELVVRIARMMREKGLKYKIDYVYNANCWTEVPEDLKSMRTQRYRWHRGLIDILSFHRKMMLNPAYGRVGLVAIPYFYIFEFVGPLIELQGYLMVIIAILLGLMNVKLALLLFISTILMGIVVSLSSLLIARKELEYLSAKDIALIIFYTIAENFGPRQIISIWRSRATLRMLWKQDGWGKANRKGFETSDLKVKG